MKAARLIRAGAAALAAGAVLTGQGALARSAQETPPEGFAWYVLDELNGFYLDIEDPTNRPPLLAAVPQGVLEPVEVNGDGRTDWLIRWPESVQFCGTGGCRVSLYISNDDGGFVRAFDRQALRFAVKTVGGTHQVEAALHAINCQGDQEECLRVWSWDAEAGRLKVVASSDGVDRSDEPPPVTRSDES